MAGESCPNQGDYLAEVFENQRISGDMADIIVVCEGKEFQAHKVVLCDVSPYFKTLLKPEWSDNNGRIDLPTVTAQEMGIILPFLYTGKVKEVNDPDLIKKLLATSHMMQIDGLFQYCYKKLCNYLGCDNFLEMCNLASLYNHSGMTELLVTSLAKHFTNISRCEDFKQLSPDQMLKIVQNVAINDDAIEVLLKWGEVEENREASLLHIFSSVGLQNVTTRYLMELISERPLVLKNLHLLTLFTAKATAQMYFENMVEYKLVCCGSGDDGQFCRMFDIKHNKWLPQKILPYPLKDGMTTVSFGEDVYFVGGSFKPSTRVIKYNPATNTVVLERKLPIPVCYAGLGVLRSSIYVVNGDHHNSFYARIVQCINLATNTCEEVAQTNNAHYRPAVLPFSNYLYVVSSGYSEKSIERYDCESNGWTTITNIPGTVDGCTAAIFKERLFVNPSCNENVLQVYDFTSNTWVAMKIEGLTESILGLYSTTFDRKSVLLIRDERNVLHFYDDESKQLLTKSAANDQPWDYFKTCVIEL